MYWSRLVQALEHNRAQVSSCRPRALCVLVLANSTGKMCLDRPLDEEHMPLLEGAQVGPDGARVQTPKVPYQLFFKPTKEVCLHCGVQAAAAEGVYRKCRVAGCSQSLRWQEAGGSQLEGHT